VHRAVAGKPAARRKVADRSRLRRCRSRLSERLHAASDRDPGVPTNPLRVGPHTPRRRYPDLIAILPEAGVLVIEVKDRRLAEQRVCVHLRQARRRAAEATRPAAASQSLTRKRRAHPSVLCVRLSFRLFLAFRGPNSDCLRLTHRSAGRKLDPAYFLTPAGSHPSRRR
jgi:hypothetical protein